MSKKFSGELFEKKLIKETLWSAAARGTSFVLFLITNIYLARKLGVHSFGEWSYFFSIITVFSTIAYFGINASTNVFVARNNKTNKIRAVFRDAISLRTKASLIATTIFLFLAFGMSLFVGNTTLAHLFLIATPFVLFKTFVEFYNETFQGLHKLKYQFFLNLSEFGLNLIFTIIGLNILLSINSVISAYTFSAILTAIFGSFFFYSFYKKFKGTSIERFEKKILRYSFPLIIIGIGSILMTEVDVLMLGVISTESEVGIYSAAKEIVNRLPQIAYALALGTMQIFAKLSSRNKQQLKLKFQKLIKINFYIFFPITLLLIFGGKSIILMLYGKEFVKSALPLMILAPWVFMASQNVFQSYFMNYQGRAWTRAINYSFAILLNIILNATLIPKYGAMGAAIGTMISYTPYFIANYLEVKKSLS